MLLISLSALIVSCSHRKPTDPLRALHGPWFDFILDLPPDANGALKGVIFHGPGRQRGLKVRLEPRTHTLEGTLPGGGSYTFELWSSEGSLAPGSFKVLSGPVERLTPCAVVFANPASPDRSPIHVEFTVQDSASGECHR